ncbi:MAG: oligosaccharide flippase family protein, partial [Sphingomicrobium sp.]
MKRISRGRAYFAGSGLGPMLLRNVAGTGAVRLAAMAASFLVGVQLARMLGVEDYGYYGLALSIVTIAGIPGELGLPKLVTREVSAAAATGNHASLFGVLRWARRTGLRMSATMAVIAFASAFLVATNRPSVLAMAILLGVPVIPLMALAKIEGGAMQGLNQVVRGQIPANLFRPLLLSAILLAVQLLRLPVDSAGAMALNSITAAAAYVLALVWLRDLLPPVVPAELVRTGRKWLASSIPMAMTDGLRGLQTELSTLLLGAIAAPTAVGLFRVASGTALMASIATNIVAVAAMPTVARLYAAGDHERLRNVVTAAARGQFAGVVILSLPVLVAAPFLLGLVFGPGYEAAATPLRILATAQIVSSAFGPNVMLLNMTHHERRVTRAMGVALAVNIVTLPLLVHFWGVTGAAVALLIG